jgi:hypothetical protein
MEQCIRNIQGEVISSSEFNAIKASARMLVNIHLVPLARPADPAAKTMSKTKMYYKRYFLQNYKDVLDKLEVEEPLLALCAGSWKADHIVMNCLQAIVDHKRNDRKRRGGEESASDEEPEVIDEPVAKRQKTGTSGELGRRKKKSAEKGMLPPCM